jgi:nucleoside-diphosphate-sugar epimerase
VSASLEAGHHVWTLNRGLSTLPLRVSPDHALLANASNAVQDREALAGRNFDVVVQCTAYVPAQVEFDISLYADAGQYVFIISASAYETPPSHWLVTEATPLVNPFWQYSRDKIASEEVLMRAHRESGFRATIIRPSLTDGFSQIQVSIGSWEKPFTIVERMRRRAKIPVPGEGTSILAPHAQHRLCARPHSTVRQSPGHWRGFFNITSDEALAGNQIYRLVRDAAGVEPDVLHVPSDAVVAADAELLGTLWVDKSNSAVFDNSKLRSLVPEFDAVVALADGIRETVEWFDADPRRQEIDYEANVFWDHLASIYDDALASAAIL